MVLIINSNGGTPIGHYFDKTIGIQRAMSMMGTEFLHNSESAFTSLKSPVKDTGLIDSPAVSGRGFGFTPSASSPMSATASQCMAQHQNKDSDFCAQCLDSSTSNLQDNLLNSVRSYEMSTHGITNINNLNARNLMRSAGLSSHHPWSLLEPTPHVPAIQTHDLRSHSTIGNFGLKFHNSLMDNISNISNISSMQNIPNIGSSYPPFSGLYSPMDQGQLPVSHVGTSRLEPGLSRPAFSWSSARGAGFLTSRCPDTGLFLPGYRKAKRVRTAFSPTQLLRLEHAFEKNHYVVGQERKDLSASLNLSETQVKVWFQNRRTKHKRMQAEDDMTGSMSRRLHSDSPSRAPSLEDVIVDP